MVSGVVTVVVVSLDVTEAVVSGGVVEDVVCCTADLAVVMVSFLTFSHTCQANTS